MQKQGKKMKTDSENKKQANKKSTLHLTKLINSIIRDPFEVTKLQLITTTELKRYRMRGVEKNPKTNLFNHHFFFINQLILKSTALPCLWPIEQDKV